MSEGKERYIIKAYRVTGGFLFNGSGAKVASASYFNPDINQPDNDVPFFGAMVCRRKAYVYDDLQKASIAIAFVRRMFPQYVCEIVPLDSIEREGESDEL